MTQTILHTVIRRSLIAAVCVVSLGGNHFAQSVAAQVTRPSQTQVQTLPQSSLFTKSVPDSTGSKVATAPPVLPSATSPAEPRQVSPKNQGWHATDMNGDSVSATEGNAQPNSLSAEQKALMTAISTTLTNNSRRTLSLQTAKPGTVLSWCLPFGTETMVFQQGGPAPATNPNSRSQVARPVGESIYAIGALCWNYPSAGMTLLRTDASGSGGGSRPVAKIGPGYQRKSGELLAMLAMSKVAEEYQMRVGSQTFTIADLIESEKRNCATGSNLSLTTVALSFYVPCDTTWKNGDSETWSCARLVAEELIRKPDQGSNDVTDQLLGFVSAIRSYKEASIPLDEPLTEANEFVTTCQKFALNAKNDQSLWHPNFFLYRGTSSDMYETLFASSHILRFLVVSLPEDELHDPQIVKSVTALNSLLAKVPANTNLQTLTDRQLESLSVALHSLAIYKERAF